MFADPITITVDGDTLNLARVASGERQGIFEDSTSNYTMRVSHTLGRRNRSTIRLDKLVTAADPLVPSTNRVYSLSAYLVLDTPPQGLDPQENLNAVQALVDYLDVSGNMTKFLNHEA